MKFQKIDTVTFSIFTESLSLVNYHVEFELGDAIRLNEQIYHSDWRQRNSFIDVTFLILHMRIE